MRDIRSAIENDRFEEFADEFYASVSDSKWLCFTKVADKKLKALVHEERARAKRQMPLGCKKRKYKIQTKIIAVVPACF